MIEAPEREVVSRISLSMFTVPYPGHSRIQIILTHSKVRRLKVSSDLIFLEQLSTFSGWKSLWKNVLR
jgi:hypothetical protein